MEHLRNATSTAINFAQTVAREHTTALAIGSTGLALATAPVTGPAVLSTIGFSAVGPVAASFAAAWQSSIGIVQAGSLFATLQGAAMGGAAAEAFTVASSVGIGMAGSAAVGTWVKHGSGHTDTDVCYDESQPTEDNKSMANPQMPDMNDSLDIEFAKFLKIDMS
ncbi:hypothetical protein BJX99DRAFT_255741 [Aspergillus californicus]